MRPYGPAKIFRDCLRFGLLSAKINAQFTTVLPFLGHFPFFCVIFWPFLLAQNCPTEILVAQKKNEYASIFCTIRAYISL